MKSAGFHTDFMKSGGFHEIERPLQGIVTLCLMLVWESTKRMVFIQVEFYVMFKSLADLEGRARRPPPPTGPDSFVLTCKIFET